MHQVDQAIAMTRSTVLALRPPALDQVLGAAIIADPVIAFNRGPG